MVQRRRPLAPSFLILHHAPVAGSGPEDLELGLVEDMARRRTWRAGGGHRRPRPSSSLMLQWPDLVPETSVWRPSSLTLSSTPPPSSITAMAATGPVPPLLCLPRLPPMRTNGHGGSMAAAATAPARLRASDPPTRADNGGGRSAHP